MLREVERLRFRVKELEEQLENKEQTTRDIVAFHPEPPSSSATSPSVLASPDPLNEQGAKKRFWEGIHTSTARSHQTQCYGPASSFYFIGRISSYLGNVFKQPHLDHEMQPSSASRAFASPTSLMRGNTEENCYPTEVPLNADYLTRTQEEYFLSLYWQSYHCTYHILNESDFREHYHSLWQASATSRKPSALADIVLAICMQYGISFIPRSDTGFALKADVDGNDATIAGRWFYRRSQALLAYELESPSITTLQCHILSLVYLCNASFQNMAHSSLALAVRTAHILGLHLEPAEEMSRVQSELRKRLWWTLYAVESKTCMKLGRPWSAPLSQVTCKLPADDGDLALLSGSNFASFDEHVTWLTYGLQNTKLILAARAIYIAFYDKCAVMLGTNHGKSLYQDAPSLESCADYLVSRMKHLQSWLHDVPNALKTERKSAGEPFSTDRSALDVDIFAPLWLQRQRLVLELLYHNLSMNLYRPFICFSPTSNSSTPLADGNAISCVNHAMTITNIIHQILTETDILSGWHEAFQWLWNATLSLIGFMLAYPIHPSTPSARKAIDNAISAFKSFGNNFAIATSAANVTRDLTLKADLLIDRFRSELTDAAPTPSIFNNANSLQAPKSSSKSTDDHANNNATVPLQLGEDPSSWAQNALADSMGMAFTVDSFNSFEPLWASNGNLSDAWTYTQD